MESISFKYPRKKNIGEFFYPKNTKGLEETQLMKKIKPGEYIYFPEEYSDTVFFIIEGKIKIGTYTDDGKEIIKSILGAGEIFGELAIIESRRLQNFSVAMEHSKIYCMKVSKMKNLLRDNEELNLLIMSVLGKRLREMEKRLESLVSKNSRTRIVEFIHELARKNGRKIGYEIEIKHSLTHQEIANLTATSRQTVTTTLNELRNNGVLTFNRKRILIRNQQNVI